MIPEGPAKCAELKQEELDATFDFEGPNVLANPPGAPALRAWKAAAEICIECPLYLPCREKNWGQEYGVWGGTTQHERWNYRRRLERRLGEMTAVERSRLAERMHTRFARGLGQSPDEIARETGYAKSAIQALIDEHQALLDTLAPPKEERVPGRLTAEEKELLRSMALKGVAMRSMQTALGRSRGVLVGALTDMDLSDAIEPEWPRPLPPQGDAWVLHGGLVRQGNYIAQTPDGAWIYVGVRGQTNLPTRLWLPKAHVNMRRSIAVQMKERRAKASAGI